MSVARNSTVKLRLILDPNLYVNQYLFKFVVKYENLDLIKDLADFGGFLAKSDIKFVYLHVVIFEDHQDFLGFSWPCNGILEYLKFTVLPFGLSTACTIFTKFLKPLSHWRSQGIKVPLYLDDGLILNKSEVTLRKHLVIMKKKKKGRISLE